MRTGDYTVTISGPSGVAFEGVVGLSGRDFVRLSIDDQVLQELLVVTSVCAGVIEAVCTAEHGRTQSESRALKPATAAPPGHVFGGCEDPANHGAAATQTLEAAA